MHTFRIDTNAFIALVLAGAMLLAQSVGLTHRVLHAQGQEVGAVFALAERNSTTADVQNQRGEATHSCLIFDAVVLSAAVITSGRADAAASNHDAPPPQALLARWDAISSLPFRSRAPPRL